MQIRIRRSECCGHAQCVEVAPHVFQLDSKQKSVVIDPGVLPLDKLMEAAEACPCSAIVVEDDDGKQVFP